MGTKAGASPAPISTNATIVNHNRLQNIHNNNGSLSMLLLTEL